MVVVVADVAAVVVRSEAVILVETVSAVMWMVFFQISTISWWKEKKILFQRFEMINLYS